MAQYSPNAVHSGCDDAFERLAALVPHGSLIVDARGMVCYANSIAQRQYRIQSGDIFELPTLHLSGDVEVLSISVRVIRAGNQPETLPLRMRITETEWEGETACLVLIEELQTASSTGDETHRDCEERYRSIADQQSSLIMRYLPDGTISYANAASCQFLGIEREILIGKCLLDFIPKERQDNARRTFQALLRNPRMAVIEVPVITALGDTRWVQVTNQAIPGHHGHLTEIQSIGRDITNRKIAENSLLESEARYRALIEDSPALICRFRPDGTLVYVNETLCAFFERERADLLGSSIYDLMSDGQRENIRESLEKGSGQTQRITIEGKTVLNSGQVRWTRWTNRPIYNGDHLVEYQSVGIDITESKNSEDALRISETRFRELLENIQLVAILLSNDGSVLFVNEFFCQLTGFRQEDVLGQNWFETVVPPEDRARVLRSFNIMMQEGRLIPHGQNHILTRNGERRLMSWNTTILRDAQGNTVGLSSVGEDITEHSWAQKLQGVVNEISQGAITCQTVEELYMLIHTSLQQLMQVNNFFIAFYDAEKNQLDFPYYIDQFDAPPDPQPLGRGLTDYVLRTGQPLLASPEVFADLVAQGEVEEVGAPSIDWLGVPLKSGGNTIGVMVVQIYTEGPRFTQRDLHVLDFVSTQIAMTIERKRAEQALRDNEEKYHALVEAASSAIFLETYTGEILDCNTSACRMLGFTKEELLNMHVNDLAPQSLGLTLDEFLELQNQRGMHDWECLNRRKDGTLLPVHVSTRTVNIGGEDLAVVFVDDLSERRQREREMEAIAGVSAALRSAITQADILPVILNQLVNRLQVHGAFITLADSGTQKSRIVLGCGTWSMLSDREVPAGDTLCCQVMRTGQMYLNNQAASDVHFPFPELIDGVKAIASVPLITQDNIFGALTVGYEHPIQPEEVHILTAIANIAASAIQRARLFEQTSQQATELSKAYDATIEGWALALELRDKETQGHSRRVTELTTRLAQVMGVQGEELVHLRRGVLLHDIGKMGIPDRILLKSDSLTDEEWVLMRMHPEYAYRMLSSISYLRPALDVPYCHHEKWDGSGYPRGLKGEEIPLSARIFAVVDVMDALTSDRPYRPAWPYEEAIQYIRRQSGQHFDPAVVEAFLNLPE